MTMNQRQQEIRGSRKNLKVPTNLSPTMNDLTHDGENVSEQTDEFDEFDHVKNENRRKMNDRFLS